MALRQMGIARMGNYRPKIHGVNEGGKVGRPKLLHNGTGHGLTGGGGLNAKGTGGGIKIKTEFNPMKRQLRKSKYQSNKFNAMKINEREKNRAKRADAKTRTTGGTPMNPHPVGSFMYGQGQWGAINQRGLVDWTATKPMAGKPVIGYNQALPWLQRTPHMQQVAKQFLSARNAAPVSYHDPIYFRNKAQANLGYEDAQTQIAQQRNQMRHDYDYSLRDLNTDYQGANSEANVALGAGNVAGSGIANAQLGELAQALDLAQLKNKEQLGLTTTDLDTQALQATKARDVGMSGEESMARERWLATHQGQKLPASNNNKVFTQGGITYKQDNNGIPFTWNQPKKAAAKPLHPKAKTFTNGAGKVTNIKRGK